MSNIFFPGRPVPKPVEPVTPTAPSGGGIPFYLQNVGKKDTVTPSKTMTGATGVVAGKKTTPKKTTPKTKTGDQLQKAVGTTKPADLKPGLTDQLTLNQIESDSRASEAMRMYQAQAAQQQLQNSLATIQRSAMQQYEGLGNDFASRGMLQSGGYLKEGSRLQAGVNDQTTATKNAVRDFINQNNLQDTVEKGAKQGSLQNILMRLLTEFNSNNINQLGQ
jgi:hypothetical protein